jgi:hypothetical protein
MARRWMKILEKCPSAPRALFLLFEPLTCSILSSLLIYENGRALVVEIQSVLIIDARDFHSQILNSSAL